MNNKVFVSCAVTSSENPIEINFILWSFVHYMKNNSIIKLRKKLDLLDNKFLNLIKRSEKN